MTKSNILNFFFLLETSNSDFSIETLNDKIDKIYLSRLLFDDD